MKNEKNNIKIVGMTIRGGSGGLVRRST